MLIFHQNLDRDIHGSKTKRLFTSFTSPVFKSKPFFFAFVSETTKQKAKFNIKRDYDVNITTCNNNYGF